MLTNLQFNQYPQFESMEIIPDNDLHFQSYQPLQPFKKGNLVPGFNLQKNNALWQQFFSGAEVHGPVLLQQFLNKPLVIGFYSNQWQQYGIDLLKQINSIQQEIKSAGGNLLIISADKRGKDLEKLVWNYSFTLSFYFDEEMDIARNFNIYSDNDPVWNKFSGINVNVPLLAAYVVSANGRIEYDHIESDFSERFNPNELISSVRRSGLSISDKNL